MELPELLAIGSLEDRMKASADRGWELWGRMNTPRYACAPMVGQSELAFRLLTRRYGTELAYTPMINARTIVNAGLNGCWEVGGGEGEDRPLIAQLCGNDPDILCAAAKMVQGLCDAIDINLGCPQHIAKRGHYGAYLLQEWKLLQQIVHKLNKELDIPVTCKIRLLNNLKDTITLSKLLVGAGCAVLTVHGRTKEEKGARCGTVDWEAISAIKAAIPAPLIANGGVETPGDVLECLKVTRADAVMSSEGLLANPALFHKLISLNTIDSALGSTQAISSSFDYKNFSPPSAEALAREYLDIITLYPPPRAPGAIARAHLFKLLHGGFSENTDLRERMGSSINMDIIMEVCEELWERQRDMPPPPLVGVHSWYWRHRWKSMGMKMKNCNQTTTTHCRNGKNENVDVVAYLEDVQSLFAD